MIRYGNLSGNSPIKMYFLGEDYIDVQFNKAACYRYRLADIGGRKFEAMIQRAHAGKGLATFIAQDRTVHHAGFRI